LSQPIEASAPPDDRLRENPGRAVSRRGRPSHCALRSMRASTRFYAQWGAAAKLTMSNSQG
jgi:hypothetical protein